MNGRNDGQRTSAFQRDGDCWTIVYGNARCHLRDTRGLQILAVLLARPGVPVPAVDLATSRPPDPRTRSTRGDGERARVRTTRAIRAALRKIEGHHPTLAKHLNAAVRTGASCTYAPATAIAWVISGVLL